MTDVTVSGATLAPSFSPAITGAPALGPVRPAERIPLLDVLRGFALFGILQINFSDGGGGLEPIILFLIDGSFYTLYSFLFGLGFAIQMIRAEAAERPFALRYVWRSAILFGIGVAHWVFIWPGDILHVYASVSLVLLLVRRWRRWVLLAAAGVMCVLFIPRTEALPTLTRILYRGSPEAADSTHATAALEARRATTLQTSAANGMNGRHMDMPYRDRVRARAESLTSMMTLRLYNPLQLLGDIFVMFILGFVCGRGRVLQEPTAHRRLLVRMALGAGVVGIAGNIYDTFPDFMQAHGLVPRWLSSDVSWLTYSSGNIGLALFYASGLTLLFTYRAGARRFLAPLAYAGRMGITNYLMQSVVFSLLWRPGFGLDDALGRWGHQLALTAFFVVQLLYSRWWLQRFQFGPVEWAWRSLTWLRFQPMHTTKEDQVNVAAIT